MNVTMAVKAGGHKGFDFVVIDAPASLVVDLCCR